MPRRFIDPIPEPYQPREEDNVVAIDVIRAVHTRDMVVENFLPTFIEKPRNVKSFIPSSSSDYSLSVFRTLDECKKSIHKYPKLERTFIGFAVGNTNIEKGISLFPDKEGHIDYYLYDYANNNPCIDDFSYLCDR